MLLLKKEGTMLSSIVDPFLTELGDEDANLDDIEKDHYLFDSLISDEDVDLSEINLSQEV
jgi:hypothetical protein